MKTSVAQRHVFYLEKLSHRFSTLYFLQKTAKELFTLIHNFILRNISQVIGKGYFLTMTFSGKYFKLSCGIRIRMYDFCKLASFSHEDVYY